jgi:hypothetical protein
MNKVFNMWIDNCPVDFTVIKVNGKDAYLFGKNTELAVEVEIPEDVNRYYIAGAKVDSITFFSIADMKMAGWETCENDQGGLDYFIEAYDLLED